MDPRAAWTAGRETHRPAGRQLQGLGRRLHAQMRERTHLCTSCPILSKPSIETRFTSLGFCYHILLPTGLRAGPFYLEEPVGRFCI